MHSEILSLLHDLQNGDEKVKEVAALQCSCIATRGDGDPLRRVGVLPLLIRLLTDGTSNQKLWAAETLVTAVGQMITSWRFLSSDSLGKLKCGIRSHRNDFGYIMYTTPIPCTTHEIVFPTSPSIFTLTQPSSKSKLASPLASAVRVGGPRQRTVCRVLLIRLLPRRRTSPVTY